MKLEWQYKTLLVVAGFVILFFVMAKMDSEKMCLSKDIRYAAQGFNPAWWSKTSAQYLTLKETGIQPDYISNIEYKCEIINETEHLAEIACYSYMPC